MADSSQIKKMQEGFVVHESSQPIFDAAQLCTKHFEDYFKAADGAKGDNYLEMEEQWGRFNQWAAYIGAFAVPRASLDARLTPHIEIKDMVLELLDMMQDNFVWVNSVDNAEEISESSVGLPAIKAAIDRLLILSANIRRSARHSDRLKQNSRSDQHESLYLLLVQKRFPGARESLCSQLGSSIHTRGISLQYMQEHNKKLAYHRKDTDDLEVTGGEHEERITAPAVSHLKKDMVPKRHERKVARGPETLHSAVSPSAVERIKQTTRYPSSTIISRGSTIQDAQLNEYDNPPKPKQRDRNRSQPCAICAEPLNPHSLTTLAWSTHVDQDIEPYICISEDCIEPPQYFISVQSWMDHMQVRHSKNWSKKIHTERWYCDVNHSEPGKDQPEFDTKSKFLNHLITDHGDKLTNSQIMGRIRRNRRVATRDDPFACPLCNSVPSDVEKRRTEEPYELLWKHIARHLKSLAFLSLSYVEKAEEAPEDIRNSIAFSEEKSDGDGASLSTRPIIDHSDCADPIQDFTLEWSSFEAESKFTVAIPKDKLPTAHDDPSYSFTKNAREWEFWYPLSLNRKKIGPPEYEGHDKDKTLRPFFREVPLSFSTKGQYTVGWICGLSTEFVAAQAFLDDSHPPPEDLSPSDNNTYKLGRIGRHNVVIAVLPNGEYGLSSATGVAKDLLRSFPNIRIGLMVGIGGGAPSAKHDIRLGDVVVAVSNGQGAVVQYDFGKLIQGEDFSELGYLNQAPVLLRTAVNSLKAEYERDVEGSRIQKAIDNVLANRPRLRRNYQRPDESSDRLYQSLVIHPPEGEVDCFTACGNDPSTLVERHKRGDDDDNPAIHYGLIASANTLMKDALVRDSLIARKNILCFEMEAAGLMNYFPCLVVRGICDYSDSHKNKAWQGYAAMAAAAYAKDLLHQIAPSRIEGETKLSEAVFGLHDIVEEHRNIAKEQLQMHKDLATKKFSDEERECHRAFRLTSDSKDATTYLWVYLIFEHLEELDFKKTQKGVESTIAMLPSSINEAYERILNRSKERQTVQKALSIVLAANRPLTLAEMNVAMNLIETSQNTYELDLEDVESFKSRIRSRCGLFITIHHNRVYFIHETAREFLLAERTSLAAELPLSRGWQRSISLRHAHSTLAELCVIYLDLFNSNEEFQKDIEEIRVRNGNLLGFLDYAAENWIAHFNEADIGYNAAVLPLAMRICDPRLKSRSLWFRILQKNIYLEGLSENATELTLASFFGLNAIAKQCLEKRANIEATDETGRTPLSLAASKGHDAIVKLLLEKGADIEARDIKGRTPLWRAASVGHESIVKMLLGKGAGIQATDRGGRTPLQQAASEGYEEIVGILLKKGADINAADNEGRTPLLWAAFRGHKGVVKMLLDEGADVNATDHEGKTPLSQAASYEREEIVEILREKEAELEAERRHSP
ncbi:hypothetical protein TGAM01_v210299 [Trichoderma gamsii]|uniref:GPI inositol-deacylase winged helix domain-containing protein n=1 Tax=Trichoderma gamsii TaxID=398673 RepID=A0A2P4Z968_9HYPO|nr:hypothetical protein TGAM01_v210299 [Trichoderma gamsii]PON20791.1 hypothetical protein TGAM01_v210299 [Trichoderma gamsii]